ncbi:3-deoxy-7-phosphoheptulonate synthase [Mycobacteriaceae bacterium NPDC060252]
MIVELAPGTDEASAQRIADALHNAGFHPWRGGAPGDIVLHPAPKADRVDDLLAFDGVTGVISTPGKLRRTDRRYRPEGTVVPVGDQTLIGGRNFVIAAGPCAVESCQQVGRTAEAVRQGGANILRGGAYKPRTSPFSFQGLGREGLQLLEIARAQTGLPVVTEVVDAADVDAVAASADIAQVGARNMQNFELLKALGRTRVPVLLKRGMAATIEEWLLAAEYLLDGGNPNVILCERGIRTFEPATRFTLDVSAVAVVKQLSHLPVIVDPSHAAGRVDLVAPLAKAAAAAGADGIIVDVHIDPASASCDADQALLPGQFAHLVRELAPVLDALGRPLHTTRQSEAPLVDDGIRHGRFTIPEGAAS